MDWLTPTRRAALERLCEIQRPDAVLTGRRGSMLFEDHRAGRPFTFSDDGRRHALGTGIASLFKPDWVAERETIVAPATPLRLGRLRKLPLPSLWLDDRAFTTWLGQRDTIALLGETLGLKFTRVPLAEQSNPEVGIVLRESTTGRLLVIGGSSNRTDAKPLADLLARAADVRARAVIWIAGSFTNDQRRSLAWLDSVSGSTTRFAGLRLEMWRIDDSSPAPRFTRI